MDGGNNQPKGKREARTAGATRLVRASLLLALEPRFVFDGADPIAFNPGDTGDAASQAQGGGDAGNNVAPAAPLPAAPPAGSIFASSWDSGIAAGDADKGAAIVVIDSAVPNYELLRESAMRAGAEVYVLSSERDGLAQIADILQGRVDIASLHIVSHGMSTALSLGNSGIDFDTLSAQQGLLFQKIGASLADSADIFVYGCDFGAGEAGRAAVGRLASLTGADVAASSDDTGHAVLGGDWDLEVRSGTIDSDVVIDDLAQDQWQELLTPQQLNWDTLTWTAGSLSNTYSIGGDNVSFTVVGDTGSFLAGYPQLSTANDGGLSPAQNSLRYFMDFSNGTQQITTTIAFAHPGGVSGASFSIFDIDTGGFVDEITITATTIGGGTVDPSSITIPPGGTVNIFDTNTVRGTAAVGSGNAGNAMFTFNQTITSITIVYKHDPSSGIADPSGQAISIHDISFDTNDAPVNTLPATQTVATNGTLILSSGNGNLISVSDSDTTSLSVTLTAPNGSLTLASTSGLTVSGNGTGSVTLSGTQANINTALNGLSFQPTTGFDGTTTIQVATSDGYLSDTDTLTIGVGVNDAPVNTIPGAQGTALNTDLVFSAGNGNAISISDVDIGGANATVTLTVTNGTLTLSGISGLAFTTGDGTADTTMTFTGTVAAVNAALSGLRYAPTSAFSGSSTLTITTNDNGNAGSGGAQSDSDPVSITVGRPPTVDLDSTTAAQSADDAFAAISYAGGTGAIAWSANWVESDGAQNAAAGNVRVVANAGDNEIRLNQANSTIRRSVDLSGHINPTLSFIYRTSANLEAADTVVVEYSINGGTTWLTLQTIAGGQTTDTAYNLALGEVGSANTVIRFRTTGGSFTGNAGTEFAFIDNVSLSAQPTGHAAAFVEDGPAVAIASANTGIADADSADLNRATITVSNAQASDLLSIAGALPAGITLDPSSTLTTIVLVGTASRASYETAIEQIRFSNSSDTPNTTPRIVTVSVRDTGNVSSNVARSTIGVTAANDPPSATDNAASVTEDGALTDTGNAISDDDGSGADSDPEGNSLTVSAVNGAGGNVGVSVAGTYGSVQIGGTGAYTYTLNNASPAVQALAQGQTVTDSFTYTISDGNGGTSTATLTVTITGTNDAPTVAAAIADQADADTNAINLNVAGNFADVDNASLSFTASGLPAGLSISAAGAITGTLAANASATSPYTVTVTATDAQGATTTDTFTWTVSNPAPSRVAGRGSDEQRRRDCQPRRGGELQRR